MNKGFTVKNLPLKGSQSITLFSFFLLKTSFSFSTIFLSLVFSLRFFLTPTFPRNSSTPQEIRASSS